MPMPGRYMWRSACVMRIVRSKVRRTCAWSRLLLVELNNERCLLGDAMDRAMDTREARAVFRGLGRTRCAARTRVVCERMWDVDCLLQISVFRVCMEAS